jgi:hypothetical protein
MKDRVGYVEDDHPVIDQCRVHGTPADVSLPWCGANSRRRWQLRNRIRFKYGCKSNAGLMLKKNLEEIEKKAETALHRTHKLLAKLEAQGVPNGKTPSCKSRCRGLHSCCARINHLRPEEERAALGGTAVTKR